MVVLVLVTVMVVHTHDGGGGAIPLVVSVEGVVLGCSDGGSITHGSGGANISGISSGAANGGNVSVSRKGLPMLEIFENESHAM